MIANSNSLVSSQLNRNDDKVSIDSSYCTPLIDDGTTKQFKSNIGNSSALFLKLGMDLVFIF